MLHCQAYHFHNVSFDMPNKVAYDVSEWRPCHWEAYVVEYPEFKAVVMLTCKSQGRLIGLDIDQGFLLALPYGICPG